MVRSLLRQFGFREIRAMGARTLADPLHLDGIDLLVGRNSAGKSTVVHRIAQLARMLRTTDHLLYPGEWTAVLGDGNADELRYEVSSDGSRIISERVELVSGPTLLLQRGENGSGRIVAPGAEAGEMMSFSILEEQPAALFKQDAAQQPKLVPLQAWAHGVRFFECSKSLGREDLYVLSTSRDSRPGSGRRLDGGNAPWLADLLQRPDVFARAREYMAVLGYELLQRAEWIYEPVGALSGPPVVVPAVMEKGVDRPLPVRELSNGMYKALVLTANLADVELKHDASATLLIDDIGEGLDYLRSTALIRLIVSVVKKVGCQAVMTTNDRFVMNAVPLEHWSLVSREGSNISVRSLRGEMAAVREFEELGLNNFDYFRDQFERVAG